MQFVLTQLQKHKQHSKHHIVTLTFTLSSKYNQNSLPASYVVKTISQTD